MADQRRETTPVHILRPDGALTASMRETVCGAAFGYPTQLDNTFATISRTTFRAHELGDHEHVTCKKCLRSVMVHDQPKLAAQTAYRQRRVSGGAKQKSFLLSAEAVEKLDRLSVVYGSATRAVEALILAAGA